MNAVTIQIQNSHCTLQWNAEALTPHAITQCDAQLFDLLSYKIPGAHFSKLPEWRKFVRLYHKLSRTFPTGLLSEVVEYLQTLQMAYACHDLRILPAAEPPFTVRKPLPPLRDYQQAIIAQLLQAPRGVIEAATGTGKTLLIKEIIRLRGLRTLVVVPSSNILQNFEEQLTELFGKAMVGVVTSGRKDLERPITIATYQSLPKLPLPWFRGIQQLITDEFHHSGSDTLYDLNMTVLKDIYYRYGFTATFYRNNTSNMSLKAVLDNTLYRYSFTQGIAEGHLCPIRFICVNNHHTSDLADWHEETKALRESDAHNNGVAQYATKLSLAGKSTLVFVNHIEHGTRLAQLIPGSVFMNGKESRKVNRQTLDDFNARRLLVLIGTSVIGEGVDTVPAECGILASAYKAESDVVQKIGRLLRPAPTKQCATLIDFVHHGSKYLHRHFLARRQIYEKYPGDIRYRDE